MQGGLEIPCILMLWAVKGLVDEASKLLAISDTKAAETVGGTKATETIKNLLPVETKESNVLSEVKKIKVEQRWRQKLRKAKLSELR